LGNTSQSAAQNSLSQSDNSSDSRYSGTIAITSTTGMTRNPDYLATGREFVVRTGMDS
jgi:hypothetical protein